MTRCAFSGGSPATPSSWWVEPAGAAPLGRCWACCCSQGPWAGPCPRTNKFCCTFVWYALEIMESNDTLIVGLVVLLRNCLRFTTLRR